MCSYGALLTPGWASCGPQNCLSRKNGFVSVGAPELLLNMGMVLMKMRRSSS